LRRQLSGGPERRQLFERAQAQVIEELACGGKQGRPAGRLAVADGLDPAAVFQRLEHLRGHGDAADLLDVAARHRLAVRNDGQRLEHRARVPGRLFRVQAIQVGPHGGGALEPPAAGQRNQFDAAPRPLAAQLVEQRAHGVGVQFIGKQPPQFGQRHGLLRGQQCGFEDDLRLLRIHAGLEMTSRQDGRPTVRARHAGCGDQPAFWPFLDA
jgi:hypothetical protein